MPLARARLKDEFGGRIAVLGENDFVRQHVCSSLPGHLSAAPTDDGIQAFTVQNDGTGPATVEYRSDGTTALFAKLYADETGAHAYGVLRSLWEHGFGRGRPYQVPEPLGFVRELNLLLMRPARGACLASWLADDDRAMSGVRAAARWLRELHGSLVRIGTPEQPWYHFFKLADRFSKAAALHPLELRRLTTLLVQLEGLARPISELDAVQTHGQFRPIHVFLDGETTTVIDLDRSAPGGPAKDLAEFIHRLRSSVLRAGGSRQRADALSRAFLAEYATRSGARLDNLPFYRGFHVLVSLCRHMKRLSADSPEWGSTLDLYEREFENVVSERPQGRAPLRVGRHAMPDTKVKDELEARAAEITHTDFIERAVLPHAGIAPANGSLPADCRAEVVQNTGTGRITVRYRFGDQATIYGKLYTDDLGPHSVAVIEQMWRNGFGPGDRYQVSEPLAYLPEYNLFLTRAAAGTPLMSLIGNDGPELLAHIREAARWLVRLHRAPYRIGEPDSLWGSLKLFRIVRRVTKAAARAPEQRRRLIRMVDELCRKGKDGLGRVPAVQTHGRFHYEHIYVGAGPVSVIDFDRSRPSDPAKDLAEFVSVLRHRTVKRTGNTAAADEPTRVFLQEYLSHLPQNAQNIPIYWGAFLLMTIFHYVKKYRRDPDTIEGMMNFYTTEFERVVSGQMMLGLVPDSARRIAVSSPQGPDGGPRSSAA